MIGIDIRFMSNNMKNGIISSGVGLFCADILNGLNKEEKERIALIVDEKQRNVSDKLFGDYTIYEFNNIGRGRLLNYLKKINEVRFDRFLKRNNIHCLWYPHTTPNEYFHIEIPVISTIHDLITVHENPMNTKWIVGFKRIIEESDSIVTISKYVKNDIIQEFAESKEKVINVIPNPVTINLEGAEPINELEGKDFILDINAYQERKNANTLIDAYACSGLSSRCDLVFCGGYNEDNCLERLKKRAFELGLEEKVHFFLSIPVKKRDWLLKNASMLVSPSMSEGFGRTPVEAAMSCIPVITSTADSLVEVTLGKVKYYDEPQNVNMLSKLLIEVFENPPERERLQIIAEEMKEQYNPVRIASEYFKIISQFDME